MEHELKNLNSDQENVRPITSKYFQLISFFKSKIHCLIFFFVIFISAINLMKLITTKTSPQLIDKIINNSLILLEKAAKSQELTN